MYPYSSLRNVQDFAAPSGAYSAYAQEYKTVDLAESPAA